MEPASGHNARTDDNARTDGLLALPDELLVRVLMHLPSIRDFGRADCVCCAWHAGGSPVEQALHLRIAAHGGVVPAAGAASTMQQLCLIELLRGARALSDLMSAGGRSSAAVGVHGRLLAWLWASADLSDYRATVSARRATRYRRERNARRLAGSQPGAGA